ncbi:hypothetical protein [Leeuwenhoekiella nanhaiensis]|uniref:Phage abortive infection protein n=1 Tax=Leeuwenhoekiella nanhaiensis TaxID=1655491 RepID=A0A2G1VW15_9FLAO|nr:hypothetical protein [Leeuwenhoekiella nanhaiensis]PHQ30976.1 hypothetical protein CJ305_01745 [Leeuwenhoekiella nanhaiensis]
MNLSKKQKIILVSLIVATIVILLFNTLITFYLPGEDRGSFGDSYGLANAIFGAAGIIILILTIWTQFNEINNSSAFQNQQLFDANFFQLIEIHERTFDRLRLNGATGIEVIDLFVEMKMEEIYQEYKKNETEDISLKGQSSIFLKDSTDFLKAVNSYLNSLFTIVNYINTQFPSNLKNESLKKYYRILGSTFTRSEHILLKYLYADYEGDTDNLNDRGKYVYSSLKTLNQGIGWENDWYKTYKSKFFVL